MSVYIDPLAACIKSRNWKWNQSCHMVADSDEELHAFAYNIGLRREWHQISQGGLSHYDLTAGRREQAIRDGAIEIDHRTLVEHFIVPARMEQEGLGPEDMRGIDDI